MKEMSHSEENLKNCIKVIFVCTGNICRSPMAEAVFRDMAEKAGMDGQLAVSSAGLVSHHVGQPPHIGTQKVLAAKHVPLDPQKVARQVDIKSIGENNYIIALDSTHVKALEGTGNVHRLLEYSPQKVKLDVPDPYYDDNFEEVFDLVHDGCRGLLDTIRREHHI